ncbi:hypothetical protein THSYN_12505 [Candidatus Thiodictyon syntrophicum]|uniref:Uncharacterized protein n=1 Tax=Candidatus Thiodictyon syntrophicum TaxID=1166950 RepID=A0A2K8U7Y3_9GAMM|nr:hypothetical protein THSYN_12505 [Candidatus Thiodictyon syntrophicum]
MPTAPTQETIAIGARALGRAADELLAWPGGCVGVKGADPFGFLLIRHWIIRADLALEKRLGVAWAMGMISATGLVARSLVRTADPTGAGP